MSIRRKGVLQHFFPNDDISPSPQGGLKCLHGALFLLEDELHFNLFIHFFVGFCAFEGLPGMEGLDFFQFAWGQHG